MLSASPHYDRDELLLAITGRTTPENAHAAKVIAMHHRTASEPVTECDLRLREFERTFNADLAAMSRRLGLVDVRAEQRAAEPVDRCQWCPGTAECAHPRCLEMEAAGGDQAPSVVMRRLRAPTPLPSLPWWRRALLWLFPTSTTTP